MSPDILSGFFSGNPIDALKYVPELRWQRDNPCYHRGHFSLEYAIDNSHEPLATGAPGHDDRHWQMGTDILTGSLAITAPVFAR
ncbi:hypothetical protein [Larsenimonas rhizosphaerae]|uniref:hypothetical protein n=1 Tax=Larsenimonas rhizosphaerae TaxID=2944682 RepID=UPI0020346728|nr:hypothetical protein [Larsenimonas rhizosphaerae]MCM2129585.1 hypothetical protein [Larsenimonas rhizosphaerae]